MANIFDNMQDRLFNLTTTVFGYDAEWQPSVGGALQTAKVHFKKPTAERDVHYEVVFNPLMHMMEYKQGDFVGLSEAVWQNRQETVTINGIAYYIRQIRAYWDGKTFRAEIEPID